MTDPVIMTQGGTVPTTADRGGSTAPTYHGSGISTVPGPVVRPSTTPVKQPAEPDPVLAWLGSSEARQYEGHWVALSPETGDFLGMADSDTDFRRWQLRGATVIFVEPPGFRTGV